MKSLSFLLCAIFLSLSVGCLRQASVQQANDSGSAPALSEEDLAELDQSVGYSKEEVNLMRASVARLKETLKEKSAKGASFSQEELLKITAKIEEMETAANNAEALLDGMKK